MPIAFRQNGPQFSKGEPIIRRFVPGAEQGTGGIAIMAALAASASYIAAPTAMRIAVPQANAALSITAALGVTFPFNVLLGIPLYLKLAQYLS